VLVTNLLEGQRATVLQLPASGSRDFADPHNQESVPLYHSERTITSAL
jgi:hypothetical protein